MADKGETTDKGKESLSDSLKTQLEERLRERQSAQGGSGPKRRKEPSRNKRPSSGAGGPTLLGRLRVRDIAALCEELSLLLESGMALVPAMRTLAARRSSPPLARMVDDMADMIESGATFSNAAAVYSSQFGPQFIGLLRAGERSGTLSDALRRVAERGEHIMQTRHRFASALAYPAVIVVVAGLVISFAFSFSMTAFRPLLDDMDLSVPWTMQVLLDTGEALRGGGFWISLAVAVLGVTAVYFIGARFSAFRLVRDRLLLRCPFLQRLVKQSVAANFGRVFATMLHAGLSLPESLEATRETTKNEVVRLAVDRTLEAVREGGRVVPPLVREKIFPPLACDMLRVGEETGELGDAFERIADIFEEKEENDLEILGKLVQPAIIVVLALIVGFIVLSMFQTYATLIGQIPGAV